MPITLPTVKSGYNLGLINDNFQTIEDAWDEKLDRLVSTQGNFMEQTLDMNSNEIINTKVTDNPTSLVTKEYVDALFNAIDGAEGVVPIIENRQQGDGVTTLFNSPAAGQAPTASFFIQIDGITQRPITDFSATGTGNIQFTEAPPLFSDVDITWFEPANLGDVVTREQLPELTNLVFDTVADMVAAGNVLSPGYSVATKGYYVAGDGGAASYLITSGNTGDTYGDHNIGPLTATLNYAGVLKAEWFGAIGTTIDRSPNLQAAIDYKTTDVNTLTLDVDIYCNTQIRLRSRLKCVFNGIIVVDTSFVGDELFLAQTVRDDSSIHLNVTSRHMYRASDLHAVVGDLSQTPRFRAIRCDDCRGLIVSGRITGFYTKPIECSDNVSGGYGYVFKDLVIWGPNLANTVDFGADDTLNSDKYTFGIYAPIFDSKIVNVTVVGYNIAALVSGSWFVDKLHGWSIAGQKQVYGLVSMGQFIKASNCYFGVEAISTREGAGVYECKLSDRPGYTSRVPGVNLYSNTEVSFEDRLANAAYCFELGDEDEDYCSTETQINGLSVPFFDLEGDNPNGARNYRVKATGNAQYSNPYLTHRGVSLERISKSAHAEVVPNTVTTQALLTRWAVNEVIGYYGTLNLVAEANSALHALFPTFPTSNTLNIEITTTNNSLINQTYVELNVSTDSPTATQFTSKFYFDTQNDITTFRDEYHRQGILDGSTANRPTTGLVRGLMYFDGNLGIPIWWDSLKSDWVNSSGTVV